MRQVALLIGLLLTSITMVGARAASSDCAPLGHLPSYQPLNDPAERYDYESADFTVAKGDETETVTVAGSYCRQTYEPKEGTEPLSDLEVLMNYQDQLTKLGATILWKDDSNTVAKLVHIVAGFELERLSLVEYCPTRSGFEGLVHSGGVRVPTMQEIS